MKASPDSQQPHVAVIGAGMAGITCARHLADAGIAITVLEKSRGLGGRLATRRRDSGAAFDHGAQYVTARTPGFRAFLETAREQGAAAPWRADAQAGDGQAEWFVGLPSMNRLLAPFAEPLRIRFSSRIVRLSPAPAGWQLHWTDTSGAATDQTFSHVVCTAPAPQARQLTDGVAGLEGMADALKQVRMAPCWAMMVEFETPFDPGFDTLRTTGQTTGRTPGSDLAWICRNSAKPARPAGHDCWVVHAGPEWSRRHLNLDREHVCGALLDHLGEYAALPPIVHAEAHRWSHALTTTALGEPCLASRDGRLVMAGDWCLGPRVELAFESGQAAARTILTSLSMPVAEADGAQA